MGKRFAFMLIAGLLLRNSAALADENPCLPTTPESQTDSKPLSTAAQEDVVVTIPPSTEFKILLVESEQGKKVKLEMAGMTIEAVRLRVKLEGAIVEMRICADGSIRTSTVRGGNRAAQPSKPSPQAGPKEIVPPAAASAADNFPMPTPSCGLFGNRLDNFSLRDHEDKVWEYKRDRRGRLTLLHFWCHNSAVCLQSIPHLNNLQSDFGSSGLEVISIACEKGSAEEQRRRVQALRGRYLINYQTLLSSGGADHCPVMKQFQVDFLPLLVLIDADGAILWRSPREGMDDRNYQILHKIISSRLGRRGL